MPFIDLQTQQARVREAVEKGFAKVLDHGIYIMGPEVQELEKELETYCNVGNAISCSSGTDALVLPLMALGIGQGDAVFVPSFTFTASAEAIALVGATPVFVDVDPIYFNTDPASLKAAIEWVIAENNLKPKAVMPVDLFGIPADYQSIKAICAEYSLHCISDAAQSFSAEVAGHKVGALAEVTATSFFPAKPLGCYGDGGAVFTNDDELAEKIKSVRVHGRGTGKYDNICVGMNARLDTLQAVVLIEKLKILEDELERRQIVAANYAKHLGNSVVCPIVPQGMKSAWAQYTISTDKRDQVAKALKDKNIPAQIYYAKPVHQQVAYQDGLIAPGDLPVTEALSKTLISLPMHPYLEEEVQALIAEVIKNEVTTGIA
ncbi:DegT/DnrJ/EryC1/StrS family aminotransferase [Sneathiella limimaris]|uniref:DegT/DnrJ/EryC1/StrS family aminotransferase n=1 Tax=Sneathiella limimaris TaxID=1964213 RepID=UPI00146A5369